MKSNETTVALRNGVLMPQFGLGVYKVAAGKEALETVKQALDLGYRSIDTAAFYNNEEEVGQAIRESKINREELFVTTKVWNTDQGYEATLKAFEASMQKLQLDYLDLYLIHWPVQDKFIDTWHAMEKLYKEGRIRAIGVSNFHQHHLKELMEQAEIIPAVNQVELHPLLSQEGLRAYCEELDIKMEAWSPLARGRILAEPVLEDIAKTHKKTVAQTILRWHLQNEIIVIPKSTHYARLKENIEIFDFHLTDEEMDRINRLNKNERFGSNPDHFSFS